MSPKASNYALLEPAQTALFTRSDGSSIHLPIYINTSTGKEHVQCRACKGYFILNASRTPTYLASHTDSAACRKAEKAYNDKQRVLAIMDEATLAHNSLFNPKNPAGPEVHPSASSTPTPVPGSPVARESNILPRSSPPSSLGYINSDEDEDLPILEDLEDSESDEDYGEIHRKQDTGNILCRGQRVQWIPGSVWDTFPYQQHADNTIGWRPYLLEDEDNRWIRLKSNKCKQILTTDIEIELAACATCQKIINTPSFQACMSRAGGDSAAHTPWKFLTSQQMRRMLVDNRMDNKSLRLNVLSLSRKVTHLERRLNDFQRVVMLLSQQKIAGVSQILNVALRNGASITTIYDRLQSAITHAYSPRGEWTDREFDVAFLIKALGGPRLLFVLQKEEGYPSLTTLRRRRIIPEIIISTGIPSSVEFEANVTAFLGDRGRKPPDNLQIGQVLMMDGVALEESCRFDLKRNCVLGLCREHSASIKLTVDDVSDVQNIAKSLFTDKHIHHGKDGTVVGIAPITERNDYHTVPLVLSASCKAEKGSDMVQWIPRLLESYRLHPDGEKRHGPIYTVATDGESSFRNLRFSIGLTETLSHTSAIANIIFKLTGMNIKTGPNGMLTTCDPKHIIKRFATMIRSPSGIQIGEIHIKTEYIRDTLLQLSGMPAEKVHQLLHPADKQNVPKAVNLLQCLQDLEGKESKANPALQNRARLIVFMAKALGFFLNPFVNVQMSLSEQIRSLSAYIHLITAMHRRHRSAFLTSALYADSQSIVKNIIFTLARMQTVNPMLEYFILFEGTDRLEGIFSNVRTQDHARNFDVLQLAQKLSIGAEVNAIFQRNPDLNRGHFRRNLINVRGVDHVNPASWRGDTVVGNVAIDIEYFKGRDDANNLLAEYLGNDARMDFQALFSTAGIDHLRPFGRYVGSSVDPSDNNADVPQTEAEKDRDEEDTDIDALDYTDHDALGSQHSSDNDYINQIDLRDAIVDPEISDITDLDPVDELNPTLNNNSHRIIVDGISEFKPSLIARLLTSESGKKVTTRPLRARGVAVSDALQTRIEGLNQKLQTEQTSDQVKSGDLGAFLVRVGGVLSLAVAEIMSFQQGTSKTPLSAIKFDDLEVKAPKECITVTAQILELNPRHPDPTSPGPSWIWPSSHRFIRVHGKKDAAQSPKDYIVQIAGDIFHPLGPSIIDDHGIPTWLLEQTHLNSVFNSALALVHIDSDRVETTSNLKRLPVVSEGAGLPYCNEDSTPQLFRPLSDLIGVQDTNNNQKKHVNDNIQCRICDRTCALRDMRNHVGRHIILSLRDCDDESAKIPVGSDPCGWCGVDGKCKTHLTLHGGKYFVTSDCEYHYTKMVYGKALLPSKRTPCTNVPLICPLCTPTSEIATFWKYNLLYHMTMHHLRPDGSLPPFPHQLIVQSHIRKSEEVALGVSEDGTSDFRSQYGWPPSDDIANVHDGYTSYDIRNRKRAASDLSQGSTASRNPSPTKRSYPRG